MLPCDGRCRGDRAGATRYSSVAVSLRPASAMAHLNLGTALINENKLAEAVAKTVHGDSNLAEPEIVD